MQVGNANGLIPFLNNTSQGYAEQAPSAAQNARQSAPKTVLSPSNTVNENRESQSSENGESHTSQSYEGETGGRLNLYG